MKFYMTIIQSFLSYGSLGQILTVKNREERKTFPYSRRNYNIGIKKNEDITEELERNL